MTLPDDLPGEIPPALYDWNTPPARRRAIDVSDSTRSLADDVGSAVPASFVGAEHCIDVGPVSGLSNVRWWLSQHGYDAGDQVLIRELLLRVKQMQRVASNDELRDMADALLTARAART